MGDNVIWTKKTIPVIIGHNHEHIMATADVIRTPEEVLIQIVGKGLDGQLLAELLEQAEPIAVSFSAIPVRNIREKRES